MTRSSARRRSAAIAALVLAALAVAGAIAIGLAEFPRGLLVIAFVLAACPLAWYGILRRGAARWLSLTVAALLLAAAVALMLFGGSPFDDLAVIVAFVLAFAAARSAFVVRGELSVAARPRRPVLFWNPRSGGGKATRFRLPDEARARGIEPIELGPGDDLGELVQRAIRRGADGLAMAGGDGSQAIVAALAAEAGLPYACIPAGTRNHFALDLGVDREDVVGALDAFVEGGERHVDLAEVNGRVFVNNVSLGVYAEAVQRDGYREAKMRTILDTVPEELGPDGNPPDLRWTEPDGSQHHSSAAILVSNNLYRLRPIGTGTRPRLNGGLLGVTVFGPAGKADVANAQSRLPWHEWSSPEFTVESGRDVAAGIDGEAVVLDAPLRFASHPGVLAVRIARQHPGASPSAGLPDSPVEALRSLARIGAGHEITKSVRSRTPSRRPQPRTRP
jgi:diacylglycerol kinase family enzyme